MKHPYKTREGGATVTVFVPYDCKNHCPFCINKGEYADLTGFSAEKIRASIRRMDALTPYCDFVFTGGEPFAQPEDCLRLARIAHGHGLNVWSYSGWTFEYLRDQGTAAQRALLEELDVLVDGPFVLAKKDLGLRFRGSSNQRIIDVPASLAAGEVRLTEEFMQ